MWFLFALGSSIFAALTSILAKIGIEGVNSNLATAIRTFVVLLMSWGHLDVFGGFALKVTHFAPVCTAGTLIILTVLTVST